jgi:D-ribose pyranase
VETVDISLVDDIPTVVQVLAAIRANFVVDQAWMAEEFLRHNDEGTRTKFRDALAGIAVGYEEHVELKKRVPGAIGIIRTGDTVQYANVVLRSG